MLRGEFPVTLDDTSRISLPKLHRDILDKDIVWLARGPDHRLCLYPERFYDRLLKEVTGDTDEFEDITTLEEWILGAQDLEIDKQGRILVPPLFREWAGLSRDCVVLGQRHYIQIWAQDRYRAYLNDSEDKFRADFKKLGAVIRKEGNLGDAGNSSHSGTAGRNTGVPGSEGQG